MVDLSWRKEEEEVMGWHNKQLELNAQPGHWTINLREFASEGGQNSLRCSPGLPRSSSLRKTFAVYSLPNHLITAYLTQHHIDLIMTFTKRDNTTKIFLIILLFIVCGILDCRSP